METPAKADVMAHAMRSPESSEGGTPRCQARGHLVEVELVALDVLHQEARLVVVIGRQ